MRGRVCLVIVALVAALGSLGTAIWAPGATGGRALAQPRPQQGDALPPDTGTSQPEDASALTAASAHFRRGMGHFDGRRFREAIREFELAAQLVPSADLWFNIARAYEELNALDEAIDHYRRYLRDRVDPPDRATVEALIAQLEARAEAKRLARRRRPTTGTLRVRSNRPGAAVMVDQQSLGQTPIASPLTLPPGPHVLGVDHDGYVPFRAEVQLDPGVTVAAYADLQPSTSYRAIRGSRIWTWIVGGLAVAALVPVGIFSFRANDQRNDGDLAAAEDSALWADVSLAGALGLGVGAVLLYFLEGRSLGTERVSSPAGQAKGGVP